ncbi:hypothetical protein ACL02P_06385 [Paenibacillus sp. MB22_1]|uniref:hypothetical protein n=1 Tax=Paenibacillus sp. MB22_1 TaxID=3383121 RepID=UPI0039A006FD
MYNNIFYHQYSNQLHFLTEIFRSLTNKPSEADLAYIQGKIDGYSKNSWFVFYSMNRTDSPSLDQAVPPKLRSIMYELIDETNQLLSSLNEKLDAHNKLTVVQDNQELIQELIQQCDELNVTSSYIKDEKNWSSYKEQLQLALLKFQEFRDKLQSE